jgi:TetR/AcrR family transcriptional regulator
MLVITYMRLSATVRREQLISAAMRLFALQGFDGTTTREISQAAGINEAIIFRHFPSKEDLYWAVVASRIKAAGRQEKIREYLDSGLTEREVLAGIAESFFDRNAEDANLTRLLLFSALRNSKLADKFFRTYMADTYEMLADFIRRGVAKRKFRKVDPVMGARAFMGMISSHILLQELFERGQTADNPRVLGQQLADLWLNGISLSTSKVNGAKSRPSQRLNGNGAAGTIRNRDLNRLQPEFKGIHKQNGHSKAERNRCVRH